MPYSTPSRYIQVYGLDETTQTLADEQGLLTPQLLLDAITGTGTWTGSPTDAQKAAATDAAQRLTRQLSVTSNFMDGYLRSATALPLPADDANLSTLEDCCLALARGSLADDPDNATDRMDKVCDTWRLWLRDIAAGRVQLISPVTGDALPTARIIKSGQAVSAYNWGDGSSSLPWPGSVR